MVITHGCLSVCRELLSLFAMYGMLTNHASILASMSENWRLGGWPTLALEWHRYLSWMDLANLDLRAFGELLASLPQLEELGLA